MKKILLLAAWFFGGAGLCFASSWNLYVGPQFYYTDIEFNNPNHIKGYMGGVRAGIDFSWCYLFMGGEFDGGWAAGPITGTPYQRSTITELSADGKIGANFSFCCERLNFVAYSGFGWNRYENTQDPKGAELCFHYDKLFVPLGIYGSWSPCGCISWGAKFEWRPDVHSCLRLMGYDLKTECEYAFRGELPIGFSLRTCGNCDPCGLRLDVVPFFDWNKFGKVREKNSDGVELPIPGLTRWNLGLQLLLGWIY